MVSDEWAQRAVSALHALGKRRFGALAEAEKTAQLFPSYVRKRKEAGTIDLRKMMAILEALGTHPGRFFRRIFPESSLESYWVERPDSPPPEIIQRAQDRLNSTRAASIPRLHLTELDTLRYDAPQKTANRALEALEFVDVQDVPFALGVWASSQRMLMNLDEATHALLAGLDIADDRQDFGARGDLLQRLATVVSDNGDYALALTLATSATDAHARIGDREAVGQTLVDRGEWLLYLEQYKESITLHRQALPLLAPNDDIHRVTAWLDIGLSHQGMGELEKARSSLREAWKYADSIGLLNQSKLRWFEAVIDLSLGKLTESEEKLYRVTVALSDIHRGEAALATVDLAEVQLRAGKPESALRSVQAILPLLTILHAKNRVVLAAEKALAQLARQGAMALTADAVGTIRAILTRLKRERHLWRSLRP